MSGQFCCAGKEWEEALRLEAFDKHRSAAATLYELGTPIHHLGCLFDELGRLPNSRISDTLELRTRRFDSTCKHESADDIINTCDITSNEQARHLGVAPRFDHASSDYKDTVRDRCNDLATVFSDLGNALDGI